MSFSLVKKNEIKFLLSHNTGYRAGKLLKHAAHACFVPMGPMGTSSLLDLLVFCYSMTCILVIVPTLQRGMHPWTLQRLSSDSPAPAILVFTEKQNESIICYGYAGKIAIKEQ